MTTLDKILASGREPTLDEIFDAYSVEPLVANLPNHCGGTDAAVALRMQQKVIALGAKFPGFQADYTTCENLKYWKDGPEPSDTAPVSEWISHVLDFARVQWSTEIYTKRTRREFRDWLPDFFGDSRLYWSGAPDRWHEAAEIVRKACG